MSHGNPWRYTTPPNTEQLREANEKLKQLTRVIYTLSGYAQESRKAPVTYRMLADNLYRVWKSYASTIGRPIDALYDEVARELGYAALAVYCLGQRRERDAYVRSAQLVGDLLVDWRERTQSPK